jgi:hypothetical protein
MGAHLGATIGSRSVQAVVMVIRSRTPLTIMQKNTDFVIIVNAWVRATVARDYRFSGASNYGPVSPRFIHLDLLMLFTLQELERGELPGCSPETPLTIMQKTRVLRFLSTAWVRSRLATGLPGET